MKVIHSVNGTVALRVSGDDVAPEAGFLPQDLVELIATAYKFAVKPQLPPHGALQLPTQPYVFQNGVLVTGEKRLPILQIALVPNGDIVTAANTEVADTILNDYMKRLDEDLGFRFGSTKTDRRAYQSNLVVQFDLPLEEKLKGLMKIEAFLGREIPRNSGPFKIKRLAFGYGEIAAVPIFSFEMIEGSDFVIERRAGEPYSENRYYCAAPTSTTEHIRILEVLEQELSS
jgi:hypothetical protein